MIRGGNPGSPACCPLPVSCVTAKGTMPAAACRSNRLDWWVAAKVATHRRVGWAISSFAPYKTPGMDGVFPALLQQGQEILIPYPIRIFRACLATGFVLASWRQVKVVFIPKPVGVPIVDLRILDPSASHHFCLKPWRGWWKDI